MGDFRKLENYIDNLRFEHGYENLITVEHRSNNPKRDFLFVNREQCKHIPSSPTDFVRMCCELADIVHNCVSAEKILIVGFAETATALGTFIAKALPKTKYVMHTTREDVARSKEIIVFEEEHSHATTQKLLGYDDIDYDFSDYDYILFVDDEISTGKTILNFIDAFEKQLNSTAKYGVASICNWQSSEDVQKFTERDIDRFYLISGQLKDTKAKLDLTDRQIIETQLLFDKINKISLNKVFLCDKKFREGRLGHQRDRAVEGINSIIDMMEKYHKIRVIGTEEFMDIPITIGNGLEVYGHEVICHATTRSKIDVVKENSTDNSKIIRCRCSLPSAYEENRETYIYNTDEYTDVVLVVTDSQNDEQIDKFLEKLKECVNCGCDTLFVIKY